MPNYRLLRDIIQRKSRTSKDPSIDMHISEFCFDYFRISNPEKIRAELHELERLGYISLSEETITVSYRGYHWFRCLVVSALVYFGKSILTPIIVTLATLYLTGQLPLPPEI